MSISTKWGNNDESVDSSPSSPYHQITYARVVTGSTYKFISFSGELKWLGDGLMGSQGDDGYDNGYIGTVPIRNSGSIPHFPYFDQSFTVTNSYGLTATVQIMGQYSVDGTVNPSDKQGQMILRSWTMPLSHYNTKPGKIWYIPQWDVEWTTDCGCTCTTCQCDEEDANCNENNLQCPESGNIQCSDGQTLVSNDPDRCPNTICPGNSCNDDCKLQRAIDDAKKNLFRVDDLDNYFIVNLDGISYTTMPATASNDVVPPFDDVNYIDYKLDIFYDNVIYNVWFWLILIVIFIFANNLCLIWYIPHRMNNKDNYSKIKMYDSDIQIDEK